MDAEMFAHTCGKGDLFMSNIQTKYARFVDEHCEAHDICMVTLCAGEFAEASLTINGVLAEKLQLGTKVCLLPVREERKLLIGRNLLAEDAAVFDFEKANGRIIDCADFIQRFMADFELDPSEAVTRFHRVKLCGDQGVVYAGVCIPTEEEMDETV